MGFRMVRIISTSGDPKTSKVEVYSENFEVEYLENVRDRKCQ